MSVFEGDTLLDLHTTDEFDKHIPDSRSPETDTEPEKPFAVHTEEGVKYFSDSDEALSYLFDEDPPPKTEGKLIDRGKQIDRGHGIMDDCHKQISDPKFPELEITTDAEPEQPFHVHTEEGVKCFSDLDEALNYLFDEDQDRETQDKQTVIDKGGSQTSSTKSRKRKSNNIRCTCPERSLRRKPPHVLNPQSLDNYDKLAKFNLKEYEKQRLEAEEKPKPKAPKLVHRPNYFCTSGRPRGCIRQDF